MKIIVETAEGTRFLEDRAIEMIRESQMANGDTAAYASKLLSAIGLLALAVAKKEG